MKPILFSTDMVRAILDGRKTMTRRVVKGAPNVIRKSVFVPSGLEDGHGYEIKPFCYPGDILWVRETWQHLAPWDDHRQYLDWDKAQYYYAADGEPDIAMTDDNGFYLDRFRWHPSIHMPREAARIFLRVTNVRIERVQAITQADAIAEGCTGVRCDCSHLECGGGMVGCTDCMNTGWLEPPTLEFMFLWQETYFKRGFGWDANPWVWVIEYERVSKEEAEVPHDD